ncbi:hypothetical protein [Flagellimonas nanhaiensis]|uniref:Uncharacterized protein n=1 Tax=Flagellimonas nanhaiensis TaxID=2292706 RepID=A0A371JNQ6_9FLAO|nr:hypothetical protein [Allomuricauda nanhaiensis]RDY58871.1 hypothetical protein DX873_14520 [Allomuricauda nanhaiensis]
MEKLEKHIKEKLEKREIVPSAGSWEKVSSQINTKGKSSRKGWYLYVAAAVFVGILLISSLIFKDDNPIEESVEIVNENEQPKDRGTSKNENVDFENSPSEAVVVTESKEKSGNQTIEDVVASENFSEVEAVKVAVNQDKEEFLLTESEDLIQEKIQEVIAQVQILESSSIEVSNAEVDSLLRAAQQQILTEKVLAKDGNVDAMALLAEVEDELNGSFKEKIYKKLKERYFKTRTALADRNN